MIRRPPVFSSRCCTLECGEKVLIFVIPFWSAFTRKDLLNFSSRSDVGVASGLSAHLGRAIHAEVNLTDPRTGKLSSGTAVSRNIPVRAFAWKRN
jgi:hypothetical protein